MSEMARNGSIFDIAFSFFNTILYCFPAHWVWSDNGWLMNMGFIDFAGDGPVHMVGGFTGLVGTIYMGPRIGRFDTKSKQRYRMSSAVSAIFGLFMLWWVNSK